MAENDTYDSGKDPQAQLSPTLQESEEKGRGEMQWKNNSDLITGDFRAQKREQILKRGSIPEFIQVTEMYQIYSAFV